MRLASLTVASCLAACSPPLDWREVRPPGTGAVVLFPCKPSEESRRVSIAGASVEMTLLACHADGATWALSHADVEDPGRVSPALESLASAALRNIAADSAASAAATVAGMTPNPRALRLKARGVHAGTEVRTDTAVFARGTRVYQATVLAAQPDAAGANTFLTSVRWP